MNTNDFINFKFLSSLYLKIKEKRMNLLDVKIKELQQQIEVKKARLDKGTQYLDKLIEQNALIKKDYENLLRLFQIENKTIWIQNFNYNISPWENVYIRKRGFDYVIQTKREQDIYVFDRDMKGFIEYLSQLSYSIIVLSVDKSRIVLQLRLL